jgi:AbrB family looped-hinge helix DNA binding protein
MKARRTEHALVKEIWASVTERGQVTIPAEVRKALGLKKRDKVVFAVADGVVVLKRPRFTLESAYGAVPPIRGDIDKMIREAKEDKADRIVEQMRSDET